MLKIFSFIDEPFINIKLHSKYAEISNNNVVSISHSV
nr:MAG TPA: hypothetical protein [Caudoviricetes sp.]